MKARLKSLKRLFMVLLLITILPPLFLMANDRKEKDASDGWKNWLKEVDLIMTRDERQVTKLLKTVEEQKRFMELFWKARDPSPHTPENEYRAAYYRRRQYARKRLGGFHTDRGRIFILLGKPFDIEHFTGYQDLVESEVWEYRTGSKHGLMPYMNFIFYKPRDTGDFQLYHPGIHTAVDLLSPFQSSSMNNPLTAYSQVKQNSAVLADASLSIIPGEGEPGMNMGLSSSNFALNRVYTLPEKEAETGYVRNFKLPSGKVEVTHTTKSIRGFGYLAVTRNSGITFLNYAVMPDTMTLKMTGQDRFQADIQLSINIETETGKLLYQNQRKIPVMVNTQRKKQIEVRKLVFMHSEPIIEGTFNVTIGFLNRTTQEFFTIDKKVTVSADTPAAVSGFKLRTRTGGHFVPFSAGSFHVFSDPRGMVSQQEAIEGVVQSQTLPVIELESLGQPGHKITVQSVIQMDGLFKFRQPLRDIKDEKYRLSIRVGDGPAITRDIHVMPFYMNIDHPLPMVKPQPGTPLVRNNFLFLQAQQYLNTGNPDKAIGTFNQISPEYWNKSSLPVIARAFYIKKDYPRVLELLERKEVERVYPTLIMLANASIEVKKFGNAVEYLESLRKYGDTVEINRLLAAAYLSVGKRDKARQHYDKAKELLKDKH